jgi:tripeptide aminopeptidase
MAALGPHPERLVETFLRLVCIDSPPEHEGAVAAELIATLTGLGWDVHDDRSGPDTGNLIARLPGDDSRPILLFCGHMDVIVPCLGVKPVLREGWIESDGTTVLGADAKAGVAALVEAGRVLHAASDPAGRPPLEFVLTWGEEIGHRGSKLLDRSLLRAERGYVLDALRPVGTIVIGAPGYAAFSMV